MEDNQEHPGPEPEAPALSPERLLGHALRAIRESRQMSQERLAAQMRERGHPSWRQTTVAKMEASQRPLRVNELVSLAGVFDVLASNLLDEAGAGSEAYDRRFRLRARRVQALRAIADCQRRIEAENRVLAEVEAELAEIDIESGGGG